MNWRCFLSFHDWQYAEPPPAERGDPNDEARRCRRCGRTERVEFSPSGMGADLFCVERIDPPSRYDRFFRPE
jgi:hypothetical protein